ncbi:histidine phosphatase superfamily [Tribonema minus]|uniref:Histidine phosphatase superfamily n=1 Tax=Tribonema minus TaxID=303371 RepID=A0A836CJR3_9STRA|nr:histidine phosphatase superfamily [Tribonema minus]
MGGPAAALTPEGELMCYNAGVSLRRRYVEAASPQVMAGLGTFDLAKVMVNSSDTDRTLASATSLMYGLYPPRGALKGPLPPDPDSPSLLPYNLTVVPVHSTTGTNDVAIRAFDKCPTYNAAITAVYTSAPFVAYQARLGGFFTSLQRTTRERKGSSAAHVARSLRAQGRLLSAQRRGGSCPPLKWRRIRAASALHRAPLLCAAAAAPSPPYFNNSHHNNFNFPQAQLTAADLCTSQFNATITLDIFYNIFDCLNTEDQGTVHATLGAEELTGVRKVAAWLEQQRYAPALVKRMLGGNLVTAMMADFTGAMAGTSNVTLHVWSGHYPAQKSVLSLLGLQELVYGIPEYAAYLLMELLSQGGVWGVRFLFRNGNNADTLPEPLMFPAPLGVKQDADGVVAWADFQRYTASINAVYASPADWCDECGNTTADICLKAQGPPDPPSRLRRGGEVDSGENLKLTRRICEPCGLVQRVRQHHRRRLPEGSAPGADGRGAAHRRRGRPDQGGGGSGGGSSINKGAYAAVTVVCVVGAAALGFVGGRFLGRRGVLRNTATYGGDVI